MIGMKYERRTSVSAAVFLYSITTAETYDPQPKQVTVSLRRNGCPDRVSYRSVHRCFDLLCFEKVRYD